MRFQAWNAKIRVEQGRRDAAPTRRRGRLRYIASTGHRADRIDWVFNAGKLVRVKTSGSTTPVRSTSRAVSFLYPQIRLQQLPVMLKHAAVGALIAGVYGIIHDQITYSISPEYFTRLKFLQFHYADFGLPHRLFVAEIGFLATWWVGFVAGWFLARKTVPHLTPKTALFRSLQGFGIIFGCALAGSMIGYGVGWLRGPKSDFSGWQYFASTYNIQDLPSFVRVAYIHNAGYIGALIGLIAAILFLRRYELKNAA